MTLSIEIGVLTPPIGTPAFVIESTMPDDDVGLADVSIGAAPFAGVAVGVTGLVIAFQRLLIGTLP